MKTRQETGSNGERNLDSVFRFYFGKKNYRKCGYYDPFDFVVYGKTVELKTAHPHIPKKGKIPSWTFNLHRHGKMPISPDFYVFRLEKIPYMGSQALHLLLDGNQQVKTLNITLLSLMRGDFEKAQRFHRFCNLEGEFTELAARQKGKQS